MSTGIPRPRTASFSLHISTASHGPAITSSATSSPSNLGRVPLDARVVLSKRRAGYVRYVGKLANEAGEWYGVALDEAKGEHDGQWQGVAYFTCPPNHGVFVRRKEIFYVKEQPSYVKNPPSPVTNSSDEGDAPTVNGSDASHESHETSESKPTTSPTSALQRTFKSFHRVLQTPSKLGQSLLSSATAAASPPRRSPTRASMIPPPAIGTTPAKAVASRHPSITAPPSTTAAPVSPQTLPDCSESRIPRTSSIFDDADEFAALTSALADHNNASTASSSSQALPLPPQIDAEQQSLVGREQPPATSHLRRPSTDRRHSTFAFGSPMAVSTATTNAVRVVELEKEMVTMRTNHENVVAVLRATNKQHAANVLELRSQVSALADGNTYLQRQLSLKSAQLQDLRQAERTSASDRSEWQTQLQERDAKIQELEREVASLKDQVQTVAREKESMLVHLQREFQAKQQRDREQIKRLREDVVDLCNDRNALQADLYDAKESLFL